jgi:hypothetical protein
MNLTLLRQILTRRPSPPGAGPPQPSQLQPHPNHQGRRPGGGSFAARFTQDAAAVAAVAAGQNWPTGAAANPRRRPMTAPRPLPRTIQLCIHCQHNPAGFWVSRASGQTARRPWCLSCCQNLDPGSCHIKPFDS